MLAFAASTQYLRIAVQESTKSMLGEQLESVSKYAALLAFFFHNCKSVILDPGLAWLTMPRMVEAGHWEDGAPTSSHGCTS